MQKKLRWLKAHYIRIIDWILRVSGTMSLLGLASDLPTWSRWGKNFLNFLAHISIKLSVIIAETANFIISVWDIFLSRFLWFIPDSLRIVFILISIIAFNVARASIIKVDKKIQDWTIFQPNTLLVASIIVSIDGAYTSTAHGFALLYWPLSTICHSIAMIKLGKRPLTHKYLLITTPFILILVFTSVYIVPIPYFHLSIIGAGMPPFVYILAVMVGGMSALTLILKIFLGFARWYAKRNNIPLHDLIS